MKSRFEQFSFVISMIYRNIHKLEREEMIKRGYKGAFATYLVTMDRYPDGITSAELCEVCDKDKAAISRIVSEMEALGLVVREGSRYRAKLRLTEKGRETAEFVNERAAQMVEAVGGELTDDERAVFYATLDSIARRLQSLTGENIKGENEWE